jgi:hypothetical protein
MRPCPTLIAAVLLCAMLAPAAAEGVPPLRLLGLEITEAVAACGLPQEMFSYRGPEETLDNVVFYYPDHRYLFWYKNRVWQVRCDRRFSGPVFGFTLGMTREQAQRLSPWALVASGDSLYFDLEEESWPVRVRLVFAAGQLTDLYVYRSDL